MNKPKVVPSHSRIGFFLSLRDRLGQVFVRMTVELRRLVEQVAENARTVSSASTHR